MQKNWYIVYTKAKCEKKAAASLAKRKLEHFCPINRKQLTDLRKIKTLHEPLFPSWVFVNIERGQLSALQQISTVISLVHFKKEPVVINGEEIDSMKEFCSHHENIKLEKFAPGLHGAFATNEQPTYTRSGNMLLLKNKTAKVHLPSLGFAMMAEMEERGVLGREVGSFEVMYNSKDLS